MPGPPALVTIADAASLRQRLRRRAARATSNSSSSVLGADHAGLPEERVDRDVARRERAGVRRRRARAGRGAARLDRDDRLPRATRRAMCANLRGLPKLSR